MMSAELLLPNYYYRMYSCYLGTDSLLPVLESDNFNGNKVGRRS